MKQKFFIALAGLFLADFYHVELLISFLKGN